MSCTVCNHPERQTIDQALLAKNPTLTALTQQHGLSLGALHRHKQHLLQKMSQAQNRFQDILRQGVVFKLNIILERVMDSILAASADNNVKLVLQASREAVRIIKFMVKSEFPLDAETIHRLLAVPEWADLGSLLPTNPQLYTGSCQNLAKCLFAPCSESSPTVPDQDAAATLENQPEPLDPATLQTANTEVPAKNSENAALSQQWPKSGKKPENTAGYTEKTKQKQVIKKKSKNAGKSLSAPIPDNPGSLAVPPCPHAAWQLGAAPAHKNLQFETTRSWIQDLDAGRLDINTLHAIGAGRINSLDEWPEAVFPGGLSDCLSAENHQLKTEIRP